MKARLKHFDSINLVIKEKTNTHTEPALDDSLGKSSACWGQLSYVWSDACSQWGKENASKVNILKNIHTLHHTNIHDTGISPSLCSAAISSVSVRLLFRVLVFYLNVQIWLVHWAEVQSLSTFENWFLSWHWSHHSSRQQVFVESNKNKSVEVFLTT